MAASSSTATSASTAAQWYEVFINHRGVDVKKTFARSLYLRLLQKGLKPFLDQDEMQRGYSFPSQINDAITTGSVHVAILSPGYAESDWCLKELVLMLETKVPIIPVFYRVTPAEVRWTRGKDGKYAQALKTLAEKKTAEGTLRHEPNIIENWGNALYKVADISGFELEKSSNGEELELELLDKVVECVSKMLEKPNLHVADYPTGLDYKLEDFKNTVMLQQKQRGKPQIFGIVGLGGVGKTTLAKHFFNRNKSNYLKSCFLFEVKVKATKSLQSELLKSLKALDRQVNSVDEGKEMLKEPLKSSNALVILDDVDHVDQVRALLPVETHDLHSGSLILITSRNKGVLKSSRVDKLSIYNLTGLDTRYSRQLFCSHAFSSQDPLPGSGSLIDKLLESCKGLPLSLKVLGAHLYGKEISEWEDEMGSLPSDVKESLKISYDALNKEEQQIFLDIACFLGGENRDTAISIWNGSGWNGRRGYQNLQDRCLVEVDSPYGINMHEHLRDLGREIAEKSSPFRLWRWTPNVIGDLLQQSPEISVRGLKMDFIEYNEYSKHLLGRIGPMSLQILDIEGDVLERILERVQLPRILWLHWRKCPHSSFPSWVPVENLIHLRR